MATALIKKHKYASSAVLAGSIISVAAVVAHHYKTNSAQSAINLHPVLDKKIVKGDPKFSGGKLRCHCSSRTVEVALDGNVAHNHACGCSKCWKPKGALFSVVAVIPRDQLRVTANADKLYIVDEKATIQRYACEECGVHMYGRIENEHPFKGLDFVHVELSQEKGWQEPQFAAFVSSIIEQGFDSSKMGDVRAKFKSAGLETYDALSPTLMDLIASWTHENNA